MVVFYLGVMRLIVFHFYCLPFLPSFFLLFFLVLFLFILFLFFLLHIHFSLPPPFLFSLLSSPSFFHSFFILHFLHETFSFSSFILSKLHKAHSQMLESPCRGLNFAYMEYSVIWYFASKTLSCFSHSPQR